MQLEKAAQRGRQLETLHNAQCLKNCPQFAVRQAGRGGRGGREAGRAGRETVFSWVRCVNKIETLS